MGSQHWRESAVNGKDGAAFAWRRRLPGQLMRDGADNPDHKHQKGDPDKDDDKSQQRVQRHRSDSGILVSLGEGSRIR